MAFLPIRLTVLTEPVASLGSFALSFSNYSPLLPPPSLIRNITQGLALRLDNLKPYAPVDQSPIIDDPDDNDKDPTRPAAESHLTYW